MARAIGLVLGTVLLFAISANAAVSRFPPFDALGRLENPTQRVVTHDEFINYRLPNTTEPTHYSVELSTQVHTGETAFTGTVVIDLEVIETTSEIVIHARELTINTATIQQTGVTGATALPMTFSYEEAREFLTLKAQDTTVSFPEESTWLLTITYQGNLRTDNGGFYISTFTDSNGATKYLATTQFESTDARHAFPCYDEPAKRATFSITIRHDPSYNVISNMPEIENANEGVTSFATSVKMSSYLVAFIVSDFVHSDGELNNLPQRVFSRKGTEEDQEWALITGMIVEKRLSEYLDVPFQLPKLDQAAIPDFAAGAMENWGLATYREEYLLYNTENSTVNTQSNIATIEAHEDAHMWFGNLVAIEWWHCLWLKEGFATLFESLAIEMAYPDWDIFQIFHAGSYQAAMNTDASPTVRAMNNFVQTPSEISSIYDNIAYAKAGSVIDMWRHALNKKIFQRGLNIYLEAKKYSAANESDLFEALATAAVEADHAVPETIANMFGSWTNQGGLPVVTVTRNYNDGSFSLSQSQYTNDKDYESTKLWYIPFNYVSQSNPDFRDTEATHFLPRVDASSIIAGELSNSDWLILNKQSTGYYRINYDTTNWGLITTGLIDSPHKIHPRNRAQFISDLYRFATSGRVDHSYLLNLLTYLPKEDQYAPWSSVNTVITLFNRLLSADEEFSNLQAYIRDLVSTQYDRFGVNDVKGEHRLSKYTRNILINLACMAGDESCLLETKNKLNALVNNGAVIEPNLQSQIYCNGLKSASNETFDFVYNKLMDSTDQAERRLLISALGCAQDQSQIDKFVHSTIDDTNKLRTQERYTLLSAAYSRGEVGLLRSIEFLNENWEAYAKLTSGFGGANPLNADIIGMSAYTVSNDQKTKLDEVVTKVKDTEYVQDTLQVVVNANFDANMEWIQTNRNPLMTWIAQYHSKDNGSATLTSSFITTTIMIVGLFIAKLF